MVPREPAVHTKPERERTQDMSASDKEVQRGFWMSQEVSRLLGLVRASVWLGSDLLQLWGAPVEG